jgi:protein Tex
MAPRDFDPVPQIAAELSVPPARVSQVIALLDEDNTVPFIARYRKEATGGLDEVQIRAIEERKNYLLEMEQRRGAILGSIEEQGKLTDVLRKQIESAKTKAELEDLYLPYKKKRKTRATIAIEKGYLPLADEIWSQPKSGDPSAESEEALQGARDILAERIAEDAKVRASLRRLLEQKGVVSSKPARGKAKERTKFEDYYDYREPVAKIPSHRYLAIRRGEEEGILKVSLDVEIAEAQDAVLREVKIDRASPFAPQLRMALVDSVERLLLPSLENELRGDLKERSDRDAVEIFATNVRTLLLAPPFGAKRVIGLDPGIRTGCKCAVIDETGKHLGNTVLFPEKSESKRVFKQLLEKIRPQAIAVGNGTGSREAEAFAKGVLAEARAEGTFVVQVSEAGASVYSASDLARDEFPDLDVTVRGAISIARRLQDPLAELVKIDPKAIGVGQYQHDVDQKLLSKKLEEVVESCVNHVGVEINTASAALLTYVAGIGPKLAKKIVAHREKNGGFEKREQLLKVSGLGPKAFEQAAGFLRIREGEHPLDASAVHPESYPVVERIAADLGVRVSDLVGNANLVRKIDRKKYANDVGELTLADICDELSKPGRDPRAEFERPAFRDDVTELDHLKQGMILEGVVTNVAAFGAFVDVGVHQDGLVHVSQLADRFVKDPNEVVRVGQRVKVKVLEVDLERKRISLSMKSR